MHVLVQRSFKLHGSSSMTFNASRIWTSRVLLNFKVKDLRIKMLKARLKMLETRLEMERHPEDHACQSVAMLHELLNDMENLRME
ncbi:hypothetical protein Tco_1160556 [Tanacetum coccineum]